MNRRKLITGIATLFAAPAIVRASSLMAISPVKPVCPWDLAASLSDWHLNEESLIRWIVQVHDGGRITISDAP